MQWYFFSLRGKKYPNGHRTEQSTKHGHWKITGKDKEISSVCQESRMKQRIGMKKALVYHTERAPHGNQMNWVMHEFRLEEKLLDMSDRIQVGGVNQVSKFQILIIYMNSILCHVIFLFWL